MYKIRLKVAEMRMLKWICGYTRRDKIMNENIQDKMGVASVDKMRKARLRWFEHVNRPQRGGVRSWQWQAPREIEAGRRSIRGR